MRDSAIDNVEMGLYYAIKAWALQDEKARPKGIIFDFELFGVRIRYFG